jgi:hypothetical protein
MCGGYFGRFHGKKSACKGLSCNRVWLACMLFSNVDKRFERFWLVTSHIRENLTVKSDTSFVEAVHETTISQPVCAGTGVDTLYPKGAELTFLKFTADICILTSLLNGLIGNAEGVFTATSVTRSGINYFFVAGVFRDAAFYA